VNLSCQPSCQRKLFIQNSNCPSWELLGSIYVLDALVVAARDFVSSLINEGSQLEADGL